MEALLPLRLNMDKNPPAAAAIALVEPVVGNGDGGEASILCIADWSVFLCLLLHRMII